MKDENDENKESVNIDQEFNAGQVFESFVERIMTTVKTEPENINVMKSEINGLLKMCNAENISVSQFEDCFEN